MKEQGKTFNLTVASPDKVYFEGKVLSLIAPGKLGYLEVLIHHAALITSLQKGKVTITLEDHSKVEMYVTGGILEVSGDVSLLADEVAQTEESANS